MKITVKTRDHGNEMAVRIGEEEFFFLANAVDGLKCIEAGWYYENPQSPCGFSFRDNATPLFGVARATCTPVGATSHSAEMVGECEEAVLEELREAARLTEEARACGGHWSGSRFIHRE